MSKRDIKDAIVMGALWIALLAACLFLPACTKEPVPFVTPDLPVPPAECLAPATPEPKLKEDEDATDLAAVKDRHKLKMAYRTERALRASCARQLKVLLAKTS